MALPRKLKNMNLFNDGVSFVGVATEVVLPTLTRKLEEYRGAGMNGPVDVDLGMEKLTVEHTYGGIVRELFTQFGITRADGVLLRFAGAYQRDDTGEVDAVEVVMRGRHSEIDPGTSRSGEDTEFKATSTLSSTSSASTAKSWSKSTCSTWSRTSAAKIASPTNAPPSACNHPQ
jgi:hypothetical protein